MKNDEDNKLGDKKDNKDDDDDMFDIQEDQCVQYEGYVYKYSQSQKKMKKTYFKLIGKYFFPSNSKSSPRLINTPDKLCIPL